MNGGDGEEADAGGSAAARPGLPDGTVTFVFTDVVGSTELWEQAPGVMREAMVLHDQLVEVAVEENSGMLVRPRGEGDSRFAVFRRASDAVAAAAQIVKAIEDTIWQTPEPIHVRVGVHTGEADLRDGDYYGTAVNLCARVRGLAGPNQVFVSEATGQLLMRSDSEVELRDVGAHQLKGIARPERVYALGAASSTPSKSHVRSTSATTGPKPLRRRLARPRWIAGAVTLVVVAVLLVVLLASGSHGGTTAASPPPMPRGYTPTFTKTTCSKAISSELATATCGSLVVPQDRQHPSGMKVHVAVTIAPPLSGARPGASPTIDIGNVDSLVSSPARSRSELIQVTPRGFEPDTPSLTCPGVDQATTASLVLPSQDPRVDSTINSAYSACYAGLIKSGVDPASYNYDAMADDVVDLMAVLRIPQADFVTDDDLSHVVYGVLEKWPKSVRTLTLDNPEPAGSSGYTDPVANLADAFERYVALCVANAHCNNQFPDLAQTYQTLQNRFATSPLLAETEDEAPNIPVLIDGYRMAQALQEALLNSSDYPALAAGLTQAPTGLLATLIADNSGTNEGTPWGLEATLICGYASKTISPASGISTQQLPAFAGIAVDQPATKNLCSFWKVDPLPGYYFDGVGSLVPTLIVRGDLSPFGDTTWPGAVQQNLQSASIGQFATLGEGILDTAPTCLSSLRRTFLATPSAHLAMAACTAQSPPISFVDTP